MTAPRTAVRAAAVLGATAALTVAGAGAASATTVDSTVEGNTVSVEFALETGQLTDSCAAFITPTAAALDLATAFAGATDLAGILQTLSQQEGFTPLTTDGILVDSPIVTLDPLVNPTETVFATDVEAGIYTQVSVCLSTLTDPEINPFLVVGDPLEVVTGSLGTMSADGGEGGLGLDTLSSAMGGAEGEGELGLDTLSSAFGGGAEGELELGLDTLSATGDTEN